MVEYRRAKVEGATYFFTVNCAERHRNHLLVTHIDLLRQVFRKVRDDHPFTIDAMVVLPDHLHCIWTLPPGDADYKIRWALLKAGFSRDIPPGEQRSQSRMKRGERGIWQRRYWEHLIRGDRDFEQHVEYIHWNPVKHGWVKQVKDWPHSSFHTYVRRGIVPENWAGVADEAFEAGERVGCGERNEPHRSTTAAPTQKPVPCVPASKCPHAHTSCRRPPGGSRGRKRPAAAGLGPAADASCAVPVSVRWLPAR